MEQLINALKPLELTREQKNNIAIAINAVAGKGNSNNSGEIYNYQIYRGDIDCIIQKVSIDGTIEEFHGTKEDSVYKGLLNVFNDMFKLPESFGYGYGEVYIKIMKHFSSIKDTLLINNAPIDTISPIYRDMQWGSTSMVAVDIKTVGNNFNDPIIIRLRFGDGNEDLKAVGVYDKDYNKQYCFESDNV